MNCRPIARLLAPVSLLSLLTPVALAQTGAPAAAPAQAASQPAAKPKKDTKPAIFDDRPLDDLIALTKGTDKVLIVKGTAVWCGPCKQMDRTTWIDPSVVSWFKEQGFAIAVDVDEQPELAQRLRISAMPTMIAFRDGQEFDRVLGYQSAPDMLKFVEAVKRGESSLTRLRREAGSRGEDGKPVDIQKRMALAAALLDQAKFDEGGEEIVWLWDNMVRLNPSMEAVRGSFFVHYVQQASDAHAPTARAFRERRDALAKQLRAGTGTWSTIDDWYSLSEALRDEDEILAWFDRIKLKDDSGPTLRRFADRLRPMLELRQRWTDMALLVRDPVAHAREDRRQHWTGVRVARSPLGAGANKDEAEALVSMMGEAYRQRVGRTFGGLLAAGRVADAEKFAEALVPEPAEGESDRAELIKDNALVRRALVEGALDIGQRLPTAGALLRGLLDRAEKDGADVSAVRTRLEDALKTPAKQ
ncbi:MAG: thioredoxin family protein [Planctomycetota bacterium]|nr:thioredoxin family protein [Planctomycetota bacterium]